MRRRLFVVATLAAATLGSLAFAPAVSDTMPGICVTLREELAPGVVNPFGTRPICVYQAPPQLPRIPKP